MKELRQLILSYGERYSTATIYIMFAVVSLLGATILFGILRSTGIMKLMFPGAIQEAEFGGAFAGFLMTLIILIQNYNSSIRTSKLEIKGNVLFDDESPVIGATVFVTGVDYPKVTNEIGWFNIDVSDRDPWVVRARFQGQTAKRVVERGEHQDPIELTLTKPPEPTPLYNKVDDKQINDVLENLNKFHLEYKGEPPIETLFPQFAQLFQRAAFRNEIWRSNPKGWKALIYALTITEIILRDHRQIVARIPGLVENYDAIRNSLLKLRKQIAAVFGENFDIALHFEDFGMNKKEFINNLPEPTNADDFKEEYWKDANDLREDVLKYSHLLFAA